MHLTVFGGTGGTGAAVISAALAAGHSVTAPARDPARIAATHERLRTVRADVLDPPSLAGTVDGADAVLSALGTRGNRPTTVYSDGVTHILDAMRQAGVRRLVAVSAIPVGPRSAANPFERWVVYPILYRLFGHGYADMARMEQVLRGSDVDWTVVRPPMLTDGPATGRYRTAVDEHLRRAGKISRADLAAMMLRQLDEPRAVHATVGVSY